MTLATLQRAFQSTLLETHLPIASETAIDALALERVEIYRRAYRQRLGDALGSHYPMVKRHLGDGFQALITRFIDAYPSQHASLEDYGEQLSGLISDDPAIADPAQSAELAAFEWALHRCFQAAETFPATIQAIGCLPPEAWPTLSFRGIASLGRFESRAGGIARWQTLKMHESTATEATGQSHPDTETRHWVIWRASGVVRFAEVDRLESHALDRALAGCPFAELCAAIASPNPDQAAHQAASWLKAWLSNGWLERV